MTVCAPTMDGHTENTNRAVAERMMFVLIFFRLFYVFYDCKVIPIALSAQYLNLSKMTVTISRYALEAEEEL